MTVIPDWLAAILSATPTPRAATAHLLFHGTLEPFQGPLIASKWEGLRWAAEDPCVAQSYCPETGGLTGWSKPMDYELDQWLLPCGPINEIIFRELGFDVLALDAERDHTGRFQSYRILDGHPTNRQAVEYLRARGYPVDAGMCWVKTLRSPAGDQILPADHKDQGRLFILDRPTDLRIRDYARGRDGGLTGRQWTRTDVFQATAADGRWDAIEIDDVHQSKLLGHFGHTSIGLFAPTLARLRYHVIDIVHFDPWECWKRNDQSTTPEFDALWASCQALPLAA